jgi:hypothetical protein
MVSRASGALALAVSVIALSAPRAPAQSGRVPPILAGTYAYPHDPAHGSAHIVGAIEPYLVEIPGVIRGAIMDQMRQRIVVPHHIVVALPDPIVSVTYQSDREITVACPLGGSTTITRADGSTIPVRQQLSAGWLEQTFTGPNGTLRMLLSTEPDGRTLHADGALASDRYPGRSIPVRLDYVRVE